MIDRISEDVLQSKCWQYTWNTYQQTRRCVWHVPNGGKRNIIEAKKFQAMGVLAGVHDLHFYWKGQYYIFELKVGNNVMSDAQKKWRNAMIEQGARFYLIYDFETFKGIFDSIMSLPS